MAPEITLAHDVCAFQVVDGLGPLARRITGVCEVHLLFENPLCVTCHVEHLVYMETKHHCSGLCDNGIERFGRAAPLLFSDAQGCGMPVAA
jgi:hypothetical protein